MCAAQCVWNPILGVSSSLTPLPVELQDEREAVEGSMVNEVKATGHPDYANKDVCWDFFINKVRNQLHAILCFSPVGQQFRIWCMQFPALANSTIIDWFHPWPHQALVSVAQRFLAEIDLTSSAFLS